MPSYNNHPAVQVWKNEDFIPQGFTGSGTLKEPYVLQDKNITLNGRLEKSVTFPVPLNYSFPDPDFIRDIDDSILVTPQGENSIIVSVTDAAGNSRSYLITINIFGFVTTETTSTTTATGTTTASDSSSESTPTEPEGCPPNCIVQVIMVTFAAVVCITVIWGQKIMERFEG